MGYGFDGDVSPLEFAFMCGLESVMPDDREKLIEEGLFSNEGIFLSKNANKEQCELYENMRKVR